MGLEIDHGNFFSLRDYQLFIQRLDASLEVLEELFSRPGFGEGPLSYGAELELYLVDDEGCVAPVNEEVLEAADDPLLTLELNRYNLEYNLKPYQMAERAFYRSQCDIEQALQRLDEVAHNFGASVVPIGILPTLRACDFANDCITDKRRYHALVAQLCKRRGEQFQIDIDGEEPLSFCMDSILLEGASTSFQAHYRVPPSQFVDTYNAIQLATPLALALGANSPCLLGHSLWAETRIPLFKQSIDMRVTDRYQWSEPARVHFGSGWMRSAVDAFRELVRLYEPILPVCSKHCPAQQLANGEMPELDEFRLHQSTVWLWNRPIYDPAAGGMLRIEMRALPAGPTAVDMLANSAFLIGLAEGLKENINALLPALPFRMAEYNFHRAAQHGLNARIVWPQARQLRCREQPVCAVIERALPLAAEGLAGIGVGREDIDLYLGVIENRLRAKQTGASWQLAMLQKLYRSHSREVAQKKMLEIYMQNSKSHRPVAEWAV
ncbi:MAG: glutamate--cysteine ligase [Gammaproteobacteria bacterium]|nr:MAG: glutamate--cysteine ligase [Gammaproteobacteria bacterium]